MELLVKDNDYYMYRNGNKWHHADFMAGTGAEGIPYTEGWGSDGFGDMTTGGGGSHVSHISWGTNQGQEGYRVYWWEIGKPESGEWLEELKLSMTFKPFSFEMQWNRWEYQNSQQSNQWFENTHHFVHWTEATFTAGEVSNASKTFGRFGGAEYWVGKNLQVISKTTHPNFYGNQFTGSRKVISKFAEGMGKVAKPLGAITSLISVGQAVNDLSQGHYENAAIHTADAVMGAIGTFGGPVGLVVSGAYFISRFW